MTVLNPPEKTRTYTFPNGTVVLTNVIEFEARPSGTHRLKTGDGKLHIVNTGWLHIELDTTAFTL